ncbi:cell division protein ZapA [Acidobacteriota bacterium]
MTKVEIFGRLYNLRGEGDSSYLIQLAAYVDQKMRQVAKTTGTVDTLKVAILAALNIADELHQLKTRCEKTDFLISEKTEELSGILDTILQRPASGRG